VIADGSLGVEIDHEDLLIGDGAEAAGLGVFEGPALHTALDVSLQAGLHRIRLAKPGSNLLLGLNAFLDVIEVGSVDLVPGTRTRENGRREKQRQQQRAWTCSEVRIEATEGCVHGAVEIAFSNRIAPDAKASMAGEMSPSKP
jgi:hypothetical protein